jgi:Flp pilus assembly protein TadD
MPLKNNETRPVQNSNLQDLNLSKISRFGSRVSLLCLAVALLTTAAFLPSVHNGFVNYDDNDYVTANLAVQRGLTADGFAWAFRSTAASNWHPLTWISHMLDCQLYGLKPWGHHFTSVLLHALNTSLLFLLLLKLTSAKWRSLVVALLFGLHPLRVESVAWVAERKDVLSGLFFMLTLLAYTGYARKQGEEQSRKRGEGRGKSQGSVLGSPSSLSSLTSPALYILALVLFALGLLSKPMLVTLPFVLLLLDLWPLQRLQFPLNQHLATLRQLFWEKVPFFALSAASSVVTFFVQRSAGAVAQTLPFSARVENAVVSYCRYLGKLFWPAELAVIYPHPDYWSGLLVAGSALLLVAISAVVILQRSRRSYLLVGWLWYLGMLVPVIGLVQVGAQSMADRYTYLPMIGVLVALVWAVHDLTKQWQSRASAYNSPAWSALTACIVVACLVLTLKQLGFWHDGETLFQHAIAATHNNSVAHGALARALMEKAQTDEAIAQFRIAIQLNPKDTIAYNGLGNLLLQKGDVDGAIAQFQTALQHRPDDAFAHNNLGMALAGRGRMDEAIGQFEQAVKLNPGPAEFHSNLGMALLRKGRSDEALQQCREAVRLNPDFARGHRNLGVVLATKGQLDDSIVEFREALQIQPDYADAQNNLATALRLKGTRP